MSVGCQFVATPCQCCCVMCTRDADRSSHDRPRTGASPENECDSLLCMPRFRFLLPTAVSLWPVALLTPAVPLVQHWSRQRWLSCLSTTRPRGRCGFPGPPRTTASTRYLPRAPALTLSWRCTLGPDPALCRRKIRKYACPGSESRAVDA